MKIIGFMHVYMANHFVEIVVREVVEIIKSGLYDEVEEIQVGCLGSQENAETLRYIFGRYTKFKIQYHSTNEKEYEFATLKLLKRKADSENFYGFYIHSKSCSWPRTKSLKAYNGGSHWLDYMLYYVIECWRDCVQKLDEGYDTCGVKYLNKHSQIPQKPHYSGNFAFFSSDYIKKLPPVVATTNRYDAEFWMCQLEPKAATLCQTFVDYNTQGEFVKPTKEWNQKTVYTPDESHLEARKNKQSLNYLDPYTLVVRPPFVEIISK